MRIFLDKSSWLFFSGVLIPNSFCWVGLLLGLFPSNSSTNGKISLRIIWHYNEVLQNLGSPYTGTSKNSAFPSILVLPPPFVVLFCFFCSISFNLHFSSLKSFHLSSLNTLLPFFFLSFVFLNLVRIRIYLTFFFLIVLRLGVLTSLGSYSLHPGIHEGFSLLSPEMPKWTTGLSSVPQGKFPQFP